MIRLLILLSVLLCTTPALAANVYWASTAGSNTPTCANIKSTGTADSPGIDPGVYGSIKGATACATVAGDVVNIKAGTYSDSTKHKLKFDPSGGDTGLASGTSESVRTFIQGDPSGARPQINIPSWMGILDEQPSSFRSYITIRHVSIDGTGGGNGNCDLEIEGSYITVEDVVMTNPGDGQICAFRKNGTNIINHITIRNSSLSGYAADGNGYCAYLNADDVLIEYTECFHKKGGGFQVFDAAGGVRSDRAIIRYNWVHDIIVNTQVGINHFCFGIALDGNDDQVYHNVFTDAAGCVEGIQHGYDAQGKVTIYGNTFYNFAVTGIYYGYPGGVTTGNLIYNNHIIGSNVPINHSSPSTGTETTNKSNGVLTDCTVSTSNFTQKAGSACINQGTQLSGFVFNTYSGKTKPDIGAYETFGFSSATVNANSLDVTLGMNLNTPVLPASGQTTWTVNNSRAVTGAAVLVGTDSVVRVIFNGAACAAESWTVTYAVGIVTDSSRIGGSLAAGGPVNQPLVAFAGQTVTNACGTTPPPVPGTPYISYALDENTGTTATDTVGARNGTLTGGPTWVAPGLHGASAVHFTDQVDNYIAVPYGNAVNPTSQSLTACLGVLPDVGLTNSQRIPFASSVGTNQRMYIGWVGSTWSIGVQASYFDVNTEFPATEAWTRVCIRMNKDVPGSGTGTATLFKNGVKGTSAQSVKTYTSFTLASNFRIGGESSFAVNEGGSTVDDFVLYQSALTDQEILDDYNAWVPPSPPSTCTLAQSAHQWDLLRQNASLALDAYGAQSATVKIVKGGAIILVTQTNCTAAAGTIGQRLRYNLDGGAFLEVPDVMGPDGVAFYGNAAVTDIDILKGSVTCCLIAGLTAIDGATQWTADATPVTVFTSGSSTVQRRILRIDPAITATTVCFKEYDQTGNAFGTYTPSAGACLTVISPQAGMF